ncbi:MAG TPA: helix-turn-helix transcriptional regulator, partial [Solirubrobacteraceae bacterium]|nr:helix-turn-helix transcriptional regulator [Solirubrobacteraceae bacterium]
RVERLPDATRRILLLAAADEADELAAVERAAEQLGLALADLADAERAGLVRVDGAIHFRHPLVRSVVYRSATHHERRAAHEALAGAVSDPVRRVWHRAVVADRADEGLAADLEAAAAQSVARSAHATAAAAFERAAELSDEPPLEGRRLAGAAQASLDAGRLDAAIALVERARPLLTEPGGRAHLDLIRATEAGRRGSPAEGSVIMRDAAEAVAAVAPEVATELALWSMFTGLQAGWSIRRFTEAQRTLGRIETDSDLGRFARAVTDGLSALFAGDTARAGVQFDEALEIGASLEGLRTVAFPVFVRAIKGDWPRAREAAVRMIARLRTDGVVAGLVGALPLLAFTEVAERRVRAAEATVHEGLDLARQLAYENDETGMLGLRARIAALQGDEDACRESADAALRRAAANGVGWATTNARLALGELELGLGSPRDALAHFDQIDETPAPPMVAMATPDVIDAAVRVGEPERAAVALERFAAWAPINTGPFVQGVLTRCRGVLADGEDEAEALFQRALELQADPAPPFERARTQLAYGERLRRYRRKTDARAQLRAALDTFEGLGAALWAERARGELRATGETARKRDASTVDDLTPQELRIATLVAAGASNRDVAAQIFVSPKTVEYHLRKVFLKLGVASRVELARIPLAPADQGPN